MCGRWERKYNISHFLLYWSGLGDSSDGILKRSFSALTSTNTQWLHSFHPLLSFFPCLYSVCARPKRTDNFVHFCGFSETPNQTFKQMISWCNGLERSKQQQNKLSSTARAITKSLHPGKQFKYLPTLVKQSGIILYCYNTEKRLSYFPYFLLIPWEWKQGGGSD